MCVRISVVLLINVLLLGGLCVNSNNSVNASSGDEQPCGDGTLPDPNTGLCVDGLPPPSANPSVNTGVQNSKSSILLKVPSLNESATNTGVDKPDEVAIKMKFGKAYRPFESLDFAIYNLKDQNFVVSNNSRICPDQNCKFQFKDTKLAYQPSSNDITLDGTMKVNTGDVTKINKFASTFHPIEAREQNGIKTETVVGTFGVGKTDDANEFVYNVNGTIESDKGGKVLSLQGAQCSAVECNY